MLCCILINVYPLLNSNGSFYITTASLSLSHPFILLYITAYYPSFCYYIGAIYTIQQLRQRWSSLLPVTIFHCNELSSMVIKQFLSYDNVNVLNNCNKDTSKVYKKRVKGWFCKPLALVSSAYEEVILVDTDVLWFKDPSKLFTAPGRCMCVNDVCVYVCQYV